MHLPCIAIHENVYNYTYRLLLSVDLIMCACSLVFSEELELCTH